MQQLRALYLATLILAQAPVAQAGANAFAPPAPPRYDPTKPRAPESLAQCIVDVGISAIFLGKAGLGINAAVQTCQKNPVFEHVTKMESASCSASVSGLIGGLMYATSFAALAGADCQKSLKITKPKGVRDAMCTADVNFVIGGMALVAQAGSEIYQVCGGPGTKLYRGMDWGNFPNGGFKGNMALSDDSGRRLSDELSFDEDYSVETKRRIADLMDGDQLNDTKVVEALEAASKKLQRMAPEAPTFSPEARRLRSVAFEVVQGVSAHQQEEAECAFDVGQATFFLARAGLMINAAVKDCSKAELFEGKNKARAVCSVDVSSIIAAFSFVASGISFSVFHCPAWKQGTKAACAGAIINIVSALAEVAAAGSDLENSCGELPPVLPNATAAAPPAARRLERDSSTVV